MFKKIVKIIIRFLDNHLNTDFYSKMRNLRMWWNNSNFLNKLRRFRDFYILEYKYQLTKHRSSSIQLHLGCGNVHLKEYLNIDFRKTNATDYVCDIKKLPFKDDSIEKIETYHVIEHFSYRGLQRILEDWNRVLKPEGKLIIECPNLDEVVKEYIKGDDNRLVNIFGLQRFDGDAHLYGYNFKRLKKILTECGFVNIKEKDPVDYHSNEEPCFRVECFKSNANVERKK